MARTGRVLISWLLQKRLHRLISHKGKYQRAVSHKTQSASTPTRLRIPQVLGRRRPTSPQQLSHKHRARKFQCQDTIHPETSQELLQPCPISIPSPLPPGLSKTYGRAPTATSSMSLPPSRTSQVVGSRQEGSKAYVKVPHARAGRYSTDALLPPSPLTISPHPPLDNKRIRPETGESPTLAQIHLLNIQCHPVQHSEAAHLQHVDYRNEQYHDAC